jgi:hypothetical protein
VNNIEQVMADFKESVEREFRGLEGALNGLAQEMRAGFAQLNAKFDDQDARLERVYAEVSEQLNKLKR